MRRVLLGCLLGSLAAGPAAAAASLPSVSSGQRPGPPLLYAPAPDVPQLSLQAPFEADPLLVSGTDAYRDGEYLYQDYLFDDHGADTSPGLGSRPPGSGSFSPFAGDAFYPTAERFANNAADIVELRVKPTDDAIVYRVTLNTVKDDDTTVVGIGIDTGPAFGGTPVPWPRGAGVSSPGLDRFITAWGTGGQTASCTVAGCGSPSALPSGAVSIDQETNQMTISVPRTGAAGMDPGTATWRYVAGAGLYTQSTGGDAWKAVPSGSEPTEDTPASGGLLQSGSPVFNLAFRFDEPQGRNPMPPYTTLGIGNWFEDQQSRALADDTTGCPNGDAGCTPFHADVSFAKLADGANESPHPPGRQQARIYPSALDVAEGVKSSESGSTPESFARSENFPEFGGNLQPYLLRIPPGYDGDPTPLTFSVHSLGGTWTQYAVFSPTQLEQFGDQRENIVVTTLGRGPDGWYTDEGEVDFFEVWADVARNFSLDPERVYPTGYSMGGYGTYKLGVEYPDLFARAFTTVGPPGLGILIPPNPPQPGGEDTNTLPRLENLRWIPYMNWIGQQDQLVPFVGPRAQQARFDALGLRSQLWTFQGDHFTLAILDQWDDARDFLANARIDRDPSRVNYAFFPAADRVALGLRHDHAYWVSALRVRDASGDPDTDPARGEIDARSLAFGQGDPSTRTFARADPGPPSPAAVEGTEWTGIAQTEKQNALDVVLENVGSATIAGRRARLDGGEPLGVKISSDGDGRMRLNVPLPANATVERVKGPPVPGASAGGRSSASPRARAAAAAPEVDLDRGGATFQVASGERSYLIRPASTGGGGPGDGSGGGGAGSGGAGAGAPGDDLGLAGDFGAAAGDAAGTDADDGSLPFTGLALGILALIALALMAAARALRRVSR